MFTSGHRSLLLCRSTSLRACRHIAGRRFPSRCFRTATPLLNQPPSNEEDAASFQNYLRSNRLNPTSADINKYREAWEKEEADRNVSSAQTSNPEAPEPVDGDPVAPPQESSSKKNAKAVYGSRKGRVQRNVSRRQGAETTAPPYFLETNVRAWRQLPDEDPLWKEINGGNASNLPDESVYPNATVGTGSYQINRDILFEVQAAVNAGLRPTWGGEADSFAASKAHLVLQSPKDGGQAFLDAVVENVAQRCRADVVNLEAQDIAEFVADNDPNEAGPYSNSSLTTLGYETHMPYNDPPPREDQFEGQEDEVSQYGEIADMGQGAKPVKPAGKGSMYLDQPMMVYSVSGTLSDLTKQLSNTFRTSPKPRKAEEAGTAQSYESYNASNLFALDLIEYLINSTPYYQSLKSRAPAAAQAAGTQTGPSSEDGSRGIILHIKDYLEISATNAGSSFIRNLQHFVLTKRKEGKNVLLLGTSSSEDLIPASSEEGWREIQNESTGPTRTIILPCASPNFQDIYKTDESNRIRTINLRHLQDVLKRLTSAPEQTDTICKPGSMQLQSSSIFASGLAEEVWSFEHVQRLAHTTLGLVHPGEELTADHIEWALNILQSSDTAKSEWLQKDKELVKPVEGGAGINGDTKEAQEDRMKKLRKKCNSHEKRLLNGLIDRSGLKITFADIRASQGTIDALKNLTSLSLTRPEAFTYGVLAAEKIPGLLLYGPPGTGKTLLAKAVAKESEATILEVSGADIYDMYVGEGEKNVRAIFSLARKVAPCVVFIDEADALFGQRTNSGSRSTHREIVNQFLREWDGMSENNTFIMVATNRPFDLDDAVLRRLPRRILVDLPTEKDREAILKIHLQGEQLADDVQIDKLAQKTPFYSGSDLKNVCVAAALGAVREEMELAAAKTSTTTSSTNAQSPSNSPLEPNTTTPSSTDDQVKDQPQASENQATTSPEQQQQSSSSSTTTTTTTHSDPQNPPRRTLKASHFDRALADISASISDDMSSLAAIRKFDEKYGDRRGRRRRPAGGYGFGLVTESERERLEDGRVRSGQQDA